MVFGEHQIKAERYRQQGKQRAAELGCVQHHVIDLGEFHLFVDVNLNQQRVNQGYRRRLDGREIAAVNAAEQNDWHHHGPNTVAQRLAQNRPAKGQGGHIAVHPHGIQGKHQQQQKAWADAADKQVGDRSFGYQAVQNQRNRGWDDDAQRTASHDQAQREARGVVGLFHGRVHHRTNGQHGDDGRARNSCKNTATEHAGHRQTARQVPRQCRSDINQAACRGAARHDAAAQHKHRDGQNKLFVQRDPHVLDDVVQLPASPDHMHDRSSAEQNHQQGLAHGQKKYHQAHQEQHAVHSWYSGGSGRKSGQRAKKK